MKIGIRVGRNIGPLLTEMSSMVDYILLELVPGQPLSAWQLHALHSLRESKAVTLHSFHSLSTPDIFTARKIDQIQEAINRSGATWYSEHICFALQRERSGDFVTLAPPLDEQTLQTICKNVQVLNRNLSVPILLENLGRPGIWPWDELDEISLVRQIVDQTQCKLLLDINQAETSAKTRGQSLLDYISLFPPDEIHEIHVGPEHQAERLSPECTDVLQALLSRKAVRAVTVEGVENDFHSAKRCIEQLRDF